jgi:hypothetical protein
VRIGERLGTLLEWPDGTRRLGVVACVTVLVAALVQHYPHAFDEAVDEARGNAALSFEDREFAGGNSVVADQGGLYQARTVIPPDGTYTVSVGEPVEGWTELTAPFVAWFARYFLLPRRPAADAPWVLCYACDPAAHPGFETVWAGSDGISLLRRSE